MKFDILIRDLNPQQQEALKTTDGAILINAGAGSGKTKVLTNKIAYLIRKGVSPENILALTFTDKAASEMFDRVNELITSYGDLTITTFHSFCKDIIHENILELKLNVAPKILDDTAQLVWFVKNIDAFNMEHIKIGFQPVTLADELRKTISRLQDEYITYEKLEKYVSKSEAKSRGEEEREKLNTLKDLLKAYKAYEIYKEKNNMIDFGDMLTKTYGLLKSKPLILKKYQKQFKYILVDEYQDTNFIQLQIVNLLAGEYKNITIVGDDDQSIYSFRGSNLTNVAEFKKKYPKHKELLLEQNYRCSKNILNVTNNLISKKPDRIVKKLFTNNDDGDKVVIAECRNEEEQAMYIINELSKLVKKNNYRDIAILIRRKKDAQPILDLLTKHRIPYDFVSNTSFFREPIIKDVMAYIRIAADPLTANVEIMRILHRDVFAIKPAEKGKFSRFAYHKKISIFEAFERLQEIKIDQSRFSHVYGKISDLIQLKTKLNLTELIYKILFELDFYKHEVSLSNERNIALLNQFYKFVVDYYNLYGEDEITELIDYIEYASKFEIKEEHDGINNAIQIMTLHTAKGKEFPYVFIPNLVKGKLPTNYQSDKIKIPDELNNGEKTSFNESELHNQEERRLLYVGMTRAEKKLFLSYALRYGENKRDSKPSQFLEEIKHTENPNILYQKIKLDPIAIKEESVTEQIKQKYIKDIISDLQRSQYTTIIPKIMLLDKIEGNTPSDLLKDIKEPNYGNILGQIKNGELEKEREIEQEPIFSASQFNTYNRCPRVYKYRYVYRIPSAPKPYFDFGGTVHSVIEGLSKKVMEGEKANLELAEHLLETQWRNQGYSTEIEEKQAKNDARNIIKTFLEEEMRNQAKIIDVEKRFTIKVGGHRIQGVIDRIDKKGEDYMIIDYKTSKTLIFENKLREDAQLLTYEMAAKELYGKKPKRVGLWFLRQNRKIMIESKDEDIKKIEQKIFDTIHLIMKEEFKPTPGWECRNCDYGLLCEAPEIVSKLFTGY